MTISILLIFLSGLLLLLAMGSILYWGIARSRLRFSIRQLLALFTFVAIVLASTFSYRRATMAQLEWIPTASPQESQLFSKGTVSTGPDGKYLFEYCSKRKSIQSLLKELSPITNGGYRVGYQTVTVTVEEQAFAQELLQKLHDADTIVPGSFVIRGKVIDREGTPMVGATVDLMGPYVYINHFQTREDGTFTMPLVEGGKAPPGLGYYLRIRAKEETATNPIRWNTSYFSLDKTQPELVVKIVVPQ